ncbi:MAG: gluconokinase [Syntrophorhabdaceae bacterium]|nr:gluconokinase [Syntrophorhabdaceae bacterium]
MAVHKKVPWFLGIDLGTGSCKTVVIDEKANILGFGASEYAGETMHMRWQEQDPEAVLRSMVQSVREALSSAGNLKGKCSGISLTGALHSLMALDRAGKPLTGIITWADDRSKEYAKAIRKTDDAYNLYYETGCPTHPMYPLYKILWLKKEQPELFKKTARFVSAKEYVFSKLTNEFVIDYCLASGTGLLNTHSLQWNERSLEITGIVTTQLSTLCSPETVFYGIDKNLADEMGVSFDTPIVLGSSDAVNSSIGAGAIKPSQVTCMVGTSGALRVIYPQPVLDKKSRTWCYAVDKNHWIVGGAINNGGIALAWLESIVKNTSIEDLISLAERVSPGADGLICLPFFAGERSPNWNLNARASFFGLTLNHRIEHLSRAVLEGIAYRLRSIHDVLLETIPDIKVIHASGGFTRSPIWLQIVSDVLNRKLIVPAWGETSCLGAALWALFKENIFSHSEEIQKLVKLSNFYMPFKKRAKIYDQLFKIYTNLYDALTPMFDDIASFSMR